MICSCRQSKLVERQPGQGVGLSARSSCVA
jgi:hypothetical protein